MKNLLTLLLSIGITSIGCSGSNSGDISADSPSGIFGAFGEAMDSVGTRMASSLGGSSMFSMSRASLASSIDDLCDENGTPLSGESTMSESDPLYPARVFMCKIGKNSGSPDTIQGSYQTLSDISCLLEKEGITYNGEERTITVVPAESDCFDSIEEMPESLQITLKATSPAEFNSYFTYGVEFSIDVFGTFKMAFKINAADDFEFMAFEDQGALSPNKNGAYMGRFDGPNAKIWFEARHDRFACEEENSCGWSRHDRIYVACTSVTNGACAGIQSISGASSDVFSSGNGRISTIEGALSTGIKARQFSASAGGPGVGAFFNDPANWTEDTNDNCYTAASESADCSSEPGIGLPAGAFLFPLSSAHTTNASWHTSVDGLDFSAVTMDSDVP